MWVRLLGPVDLLVDGRYRPVRGTRRLAVLAALALHPGKTVGADQLADIVWGDAAPATAATTLHNHIWHLRRALGDGASIRTRAQGYLLQVDGAEATDVEVAHRLIQEADRCREPEQRRRILKAAVQLWRGEPLSGLAGLAWFEAKVHRLEQLHLQALVALIDSRLSAGEHGQVVAELEELCQRHPMHEQLHGQLMLALYRAARQGDALAVYRRLRGTLDGELGVAPGKELRDLEVAILRHDPGLQPGPQDGPEAATTAVVARPAQLPVAVAAFTGRQRELRRLDELLSRPAVVITAVSGTAGVGKTALAVYWSHRAADRFPDGQLYINLRGFDPAGPVAPTDAIRRFLDALAVPTDRIPASLDGRVDLYRSLLSGKRILVLLDNAATAEQVRPLLPGAVGCLALVTSRNPLLGLLAAEAAESITLDLLSLEESRQLLADRLGTTRVGAEPDAVDDLVAACARLPLALAIAAAHASARPDRQLSGLVDELQRSDDRLGLLAADDPRLDLRTVFSWSYDALSPGAARLFRLCGLHPGPDITVASAASLTAVPAVQVRQQLAELARAHLCGDASPGRYGCHDLLRAYAADLVARVDTADERRAATVRIIDHYTRSACTGEWVLNEHRAPVGVALPPAPSGVHPQRPADRHQALAWFAAEYPVLLAAVRTAHAVGLDRHTIHLAWSLYTFVNRQLLLDDSAAAYRLALASAERLGHASARQFALRWLAQVEVATDDRLDAARRHLEQALDLCSETDDPAEHARTYLSLVDVACRQERHAEALDYAERAFRLFQLADHRHGQASTLNTIGWCRALLGDLHNALSACRRALAMFSEIDAPDQEAATWDSLGYIHTQLGDHAQAVDCYTRALTLFREISDRSLEAVILTNLGDSYRHAGQQTQARAAWQCALGILEQSGRNAAADHLRNRLHRQVDRR